MMSRISNIPVRPVAQGLECSFKGMFPRKLMVIIYVMNIGTEKNKPFSLSLKVFNVLSLLFINIKNNVSWL